MSDQSKKKITLAEQKALVAELERNKPSITLRCPRCGKHFKKAPSNTGKVRSLVENTAFGAALGLKAGTRVGSIGGKALAIPCAVAGGLLTLAFKKVVDKSTCPDCGTRFDSPN